MNFQLDVNYFLHKQSHSCHVRMWEEYISERMSKSNVPLKILSLMDISCWHRSVLFSSTTSLSYPGKIYMRDSFWKILTKQDLVSLAMITEQLQEN